MIFSNKIVFNQRNIELVWSARPADRDREMARVMEVLTNQEGQTITIPDSTKVPIGMNFLIENPGSHDLDVLTHESTLLKTIPANETFYFYLMDNKTKSGDWSVFFFDPRHAREDN